jgi:hypothetical protein
MTAAAALLPTSTSAQRHADDCRSKSTMKTNTSSGRDYRRARIRRCRASLSHLAGWARNRLCAFLPRSQITLFQSFGSKLAIQTIHRASVPSSSLLLLAGITVRPVPCNYNVIQSCQPLSRRCHRRSGLVENQENALSRPRSLCPCHFAVKGRTCVFKTSHARASKCRPDGNPSAMSRVL